MQIDGLPKTSLSCWSVGLIVASVPFFALAEVIVGPGPNYNMALAYALTTVLAGILVVAFVTGLISIIKRKERSILVFVVMAIALWGLIGAIGSLFGLAKQMTFRSGNRQYGCYQGYNNLVPHEMRGGLYFLTRRQIPST